MPARTRSLLLASALLLSSCATSPNTAPRGQAKIFSELLTRVEQNYVEQKSYDEMTDSVLDGMARWAWLKPGWLRKRHYFKSAKWSDTGSGGGQVPSSDVKRFAEALDAMKAARPAVTRAEMAEAGFNHMLKALDGESNYKTSEDVAMIRASASSAGAGSVGLAFRSVKGKVTVLEVYPGSPAERAGILPGDVIVGIGNNLVWNRTPIGVEMLLRGKIASKAHILLRRHGRHVRVTATREIVKSQPVTARIDNDGIVWIKVRDFRSNVINRMRSSIEQLQAENKTKLWGLVLDLRNNPGGEIQSAVSTADYFLARGYIMYQIGRHKSSNLTYIADPRQSESDFPDLPVVVLINHFTAGGAEVVAAALQDNGRAVIIGSRSSGSGYLQSIIMLSNGARLRLTTAQIYRPAATSLVHNGVVPNLCLVAKGHKKDASLDIRGISGTARGCPETEYVDPGKDIRIAEIASTLILNPQKYHQYLRKPIRLPGT